MHGLTNTIQNNALASLTAGASQHVVNAIADASESTGVDFAYLVQQAKAESSFDPNAKASTSSATGLFQFINSTWERMIERYGAEYGIETEGKTRQEILDLRKDPEIASNMAAELASENQSFLEANYGGEIGATELYFAHFMGAGGAASFLNARDANGSQPAAVIFPDAAKANQNVFYDRGTGRAKSLDEVYAFFDQKFSIDDLDANGIAPPLEPKPESTATQPANSVVFANNSFSSLYSGGLYDLNSFGSRPTPLPHYNLVQDPLEVMLLSQLDTGFISDHNNDRDNNGRYNSIL